MIGAQIAAESAPDGSTFLLSNIVLISVSPFIYAQVAYDPLKSFSHLNFIGAATTPIAVVPSSLPVKTFADLVACTRAAKDTVTFGSSGVGSAGHLVGEFFQCECKVELNHIPCMGSAPMITDLLGGQVQMSFDTLRQIVPHLETGALRGLAVTSPKRVGAAPDVPSVVEFGYPRLAVENWIALSAPAGLPVSIAVTTHRYVTEALALPEVGKRFDELSIERRTMSAADFQKFVRAEVGEYAPVLHAAGIEVN